MNCRLYVIGTTLTACLMAVPTMAESVYQEPAVFVAEAFADQPPAPELLWISAETREAAHQVLGRDLLQLRVRYWQQDGRSVWILDEIGKDQPITTGVIINNGAIESVQVLVFRESRGWEVRYPFFTDQFVAARLNKHSRLDKHIDNISGATLSVNALKRQARLALLYAAQLNTTSELSNAD
jgi:hypothetical protein